MGCGAKERTLGERRSVLQQCRGDGRREVKARQRGGQGGIAELTERAFNEDNPERCRKGYGEEGLEGEGKAVGQDER